MDGWMEGWWLLAVGGCWCPTVGLTGAGTAIARYTSARLKALQCSNKQHFVEVS